MNYTKGNWKIGEDNDVFTDDCACIAKICGAPEGIKESLVNAQLIAAAPNMYEALKLLQSALTEYNLRNIKKRYSLCLADAIASKALAKAEGKINEK